MLLTRYTLRRACFFRRCIFSAPCYYVLFAPRVSVMPQRDMPPYDFAYAMPLMPPMPPLMLLRHAATDVIDFTLLLDAAMLRVAATPYAYIIAATLICCAFYR